MKFYIGDMHLGHQNVIKYDNRPFSSVEEMGSIMIRGWNARVTKNDDVYVIGDFCYKSVVPAEWYLRQLNGRKHLIVGNHDGKILKNPEAVKHFVSIDRYLEVTDDEKHIILCHFPLAEWNGERKGTWHVYAHIHNRTDGAYKWVYEKDNALNAGACINGYVPVTFRQLVENNRIFKENHRL